MGQAAPSRVPAHVRSHVKGRMHASTQADIALRGFSCYLHGSDAAACAASDACVMIDGSCASRRPLHKFLKHVQALCSLHDGGSFPAHVKSIMQRMQQFLHMPSQHGRTDSQQCAALSYRVKQLEAKMRRALDTLGAPSVASLVKDAKVLVRASRMVLAGASQRAVDAFVREHIKRQFRGKHKSGMALKALAIGIGLMCVLTGASEVVAPHAPSVATSSLPSTSLGDPLSSMPVVPRWFPDASPVVPHLHAAVDFERGSKEVAIAQGQVMAAVKLGIPHASDAELAKMTDEGRAWAKTIAKEVRTRGRLRTKRLPHSGVHHSKRVVDDDDVVIGYMKYVTDTGAAHEAAAAALFRAAGMIQVPEVMVRIDKARFAAVVLTQPVPHAQTVYEATDGDVGRVLTIIHHSYNGQMMQILDAASGNLDRHSSNMMLTDSDVLVPIDNDNMFVNAEPRNMFAERVCVELRSDVLDGLRNMLQEDGTPTAELAAALEGLEPHERRVFVTKLRAVVAWTREGLRDLEILVDLVSHPLKSATLQATAGDGVGMGTRLLTSNVMYSMQRHGRHAVGTTLNRLVMRLHRLYRDDSRPSKYELEQVMNHLKKLGPLVGVETSTGKWLGDRLATNKFDWMNCEGEWRATVHQIVAPVSRSLVRLIRSNDRATADTARQVTCQLFGVAISTSLVMGSMWMKL